MAGKTGDRVGGPRCIALLGPQGSGKTTLLEAILHRTGAISRMGDPQAGTAVGDASAVAKEFSGGVEPNVATCEFLGDTYTFIDCPVPPSSPGNVRSSCRAWMRRWSSSSRIPPAPRRCN